MPSLHRIAVNLLFIMISSLSTLCPKRCHGLQILFPRCMTYRSFSLQSKGRNSFHGLTTSNDYYLIRYRQHQRRSALIKLYSSNSHADLSNVAANHNDGKRVVTAFLDHYLADLEQSGKLTANEAKSIADSILNFLEDEIPMEKATITNPDNILTKSVQLFIVQKESRIRSNALPIQNVGGYVRAILRNQWDGSGDGITVGNSRRDDAIIGQQQQEEQQPSKSDGIDDIRRNLRSSFFVNGQIHKDELSDECIRALSQSMEQAMYALDAYVSQKIRREANNMPPITDPSSYILTILRNAPSSTAPSTSATKHQSSTHNLEDEDDVSSLQLPAQSTESLTTSTPSKSLVTMNQVETTLHLLRKLDEPISSIKGVGSKTEAAFHKLGLVTLRDLLWHFPRTFIDRSTLQSDIRDVPDGDIGTVRLTVSKDAIKGSTITCIDESGNNVDVTFFYGRTKRGTIAATNKLKEICNHHSIIVSGKVKHSRKSSTMFNPDKCVSADEAESLLGIEPVYALTSGLRKTVLMNAIGEALEVATELIESVPESLSNEALEALSWPTLSDALVAAHQPSSIAEAGPDSPARQRLAFEELCIQQAQIALMRWNLKYNNINSIQKSQQQLSSSWNESPLVAAAVESLPFQLTESQEDCLTEMWNDAILDTGTRMIRLLQGEVGSGKTVLAYLLSLGCIEARQGGGRVAAILAPTQLLALQHAASISDFVSALKIGRDHSSGIRDVHVEVLTGAVTGRHREELLQRLEATSDNDAVILIGTHALMTANITSRLQQLPSVSSSSSKGLALSVVDEEQRFGVMQREALSSCAANTLYMSATPIPRTLMTARGRGNGLMDYTKLESENSRTVATTIASTDEMNRVISSLQNKIDQGSKCFWVLPRIGESEDPPDSQQASVERRYRALADIFGEGKVGFVHGRMRIDDREKQLAAFADDRSDIAIIVGTTVIEVGIDIPNVNLLIVEQAERFGLSQLHQLRGRIGRNGSRDDLDCHCLLLTDTTTKDGSSSLTRLDILRETQDGAVIAEADMMLRGAGDVLGFIQSGIKNGYAVDPKHHWEMIPAASLIGRSFLSNHQDDDQNIYDQEDAVSKLLLKHYGEIESYKEVSASSQSGFAMRTMMLLFREEEKDNLNISLSTLQQLQTSQGETLSREDNLISDKICSVLGEGTTHHINQQKDETPLPSKSTQSKPIASNHRTITTKKNTVDFLSDVCFIVLDVETTGLDTTSNHVIQLAGKELGASPDDEFSKYILPPVQIPAKIEEITGITDDFIQSGSFKEFKEVYLDFHDFCIQQARGRSICLVAHNAKFDIEMIESELRRWRTVDKSAPVLADTFAASLDTLHLFRDNQFWRSPQYTRPKSFGLGKIYHHMFNEDIVNAHNAIGDVRALERLLLNSNFDDWRSVGNTIQKPFIKIT